jgi:molybdate transport system substrate-binding protein
MKERNNTRGLFSKPVLALTLIISMFLSTAGFCTEKEIVVAGAPCLTDALEEISQQYEIKHTGVRVHLNLTASGILQQQIEQGAPIDVFMSGSSVYMDKLDKKGLIDTNSKFIFAYNEIVLATPKDSALKNWPDLTGKKVTKIAIGNPDTVSAGMYGKETLTYLKLWDSLQGKLVMAENVRQALTYVQDKNVEAGILFKTDALIGKNIKIIASAPADSHQSIEYPAAVIKATHHPAEAKQFLDFLKTSKAKNILKKYGFVLDKPKGKASK